MSEQHWVARWLREPLLHFLFIAALIFAFNALRGPAYDLGDREIVITEQQTQRLYNYWQESWKRPPTPSELDGLIRDSIKEEIYVREARRLGLDDNDPIIRKRLRNKMEFAANAQAENSSPTDADLQKWIGDNPVRYSADPLYSFEQRYFENEEAAKSALKSENLQGNISSLPKQVTATTGANISKTFGRQFTQALQQLAKNDLSSDWHGPIASGLGFHLVKISNIEATDTPSLNSIRQQVENDWQYATRERRVSKAYQKLLDGYDVRIELPQ